MMNKLMFFFFFCCGCVGVLHASEVAPSGEQGNNEPATEFPIVDGKLLCTQVEQEGEEPATEFPIVDGKLLCTQVEQDGEEPSGELPIVDGTMLSAEEEAEELTEGFQSRCRKCRKPNYV